LESLRQKLLQNIQDFCKENKISKNDIKAEFFEEFYQLIEKAGYNTLKGEQLEISLLGDLERIRAKKEENINIFLQNTYSEKELLLEDDFLKYNLKEEL